MKLNLRYFAHKDEPSSPERHTRVLKRDRRSPVRGACPGNDSCDADVEDGVVDDSEQACIAVAAAQFTPFPLNVLPNAGDFSHNF